MKINYFLIIGLIALTISCGESKKEAEQNRIHLEKIEVGKSKLKMDLSNELDRLKQLLKVEENRLTEINEFQIGRSTSTKENQILENYNRINLLNNHISKVENEISLTHLRETFEFQDSPVEVINYLFQSAKTFNFGNLRYLCDPYGEYDGDARGICLVEMFPIERQHQFAQNFKNGRIIGEPKVLDDTAEVEIAYGQSSNQLQTIKLVKRIDKWYIESL